MLLWNSQTTCFLLAALLHCEISWYFQSNTSADKFTGETKINCITNNFLKLPNQIRDINEPTCDWLSKVIPTALNLSDDEWYLTAKNALWSYRWNPRPAIQLSVIWGGIEALFVIERKIKQRISKAISRFLCGNDDMVDNIKRLYSVRSKAVHELRNGENSALQESANLLHNLILKCVENKQLPDLCVLLDSDE